MSPNPPPILDYATPKPNGRLRKTTVWLLGILFLIYFFSSFLVFGPNFRFDVESAVHVFVFITSFIYLLATVGIHYGSWRFSLIALITVLLNIAMLLFALAWSVYDLTTSTSRFVFVNFEIRLFLFIPPFVISGILAFLLYRLLPQMKLLQCQPPALDQFHDTIP